MEDPMRRWNRTSDRLKMVLAGIVLGLTAGVAPAQGPPVYGTPSPSYVPCPYPTGPGAPGMPWTTTPSPGGTTTTPPGAPSTDTSTATPTPSGASADMFGGQARGSDIGAGVAVARDGGAYLDSAVPITQFRLR